jgi:hypothetical protein
MVFRFNSNPRYTIRLCIRYNNSADFEDISLNSVFGARKEVGSLELSLLNPATNDMYVRFLL